MKPDQVERFRYVSYNFDLASQTLLCQYALDDLLFEERISFSHVCLSEAELNRARGAFRLVFLLAGISYYKAAAPPVAIVEVEGLTPAERRLLNSYYLDGLGEFAFQNNLDLSGLTIVAEERRAAEPAQRTDLTRPLIPFGGGLDSIVTVEGIRGKVAEAALFIVSREGDRFDAIESAALVTGLPVVRAERRIDEKVLRSAELGFHNGHVPVTGIISAIAVAAALLDGRDSVVMSNEWSASSGNVIVGERSVNHQWSKTLEFEILFRDAIAESISAPMDYFSWLRPFSELWVASRFAELSRYWTTFRSCNRSFHIERAQRLDRWCGECDKCNFIDLILSPYVPRENLESVFDGNEPLANAALTESFRTLLGLNGEIKPFECVGDVDECRAAIMLTSRRPDRLGDPVVQLLAAEVAGAHAAGAADFERLMLPMGPHRIPREYAPSDLLD